VRVGGDYEHFEHFLAFKRPFFIKLYEFADFGTNKLNYCSVEWRLFFWEDLVDKAEDFLLCVKIVSLFEFYS